MAQGDSFADWWFEDYGDRQMRKRLEGEIEDAAYAQSSAFQAQLSRLQGTLEQRFDKLSKAFYAFVELSDVRAELAEFEDETTIRHAAMRILRALRGRATAEAPEQSGAGPAGRPGLTSELPLCPGYWLRPATLCLAAAVREDEPAVAAALAEARGLDPVRTAVFLAATLALAGQAARASELLPAALQEPGEQVTYAQRVLWEACAHGAFGDAGEGVAGAWVAGFAQSMGNEAALAEAGQWRAAADKALGAGGRPGRAAERLPWSLERMDTLVAPLVAARKLSALGTWVREAVTGEAASGTPEAPKEEGTSPEAGLAAVAAALVDEGSRNEIALARRARELREMIDDRKAARRPSWDDTQDSLLALVRADAFGKDLRLRRVALTACAEWSASVASTLAEEAGVVPPGEVDITINRQAVRISASGTASVYDAVVKIKAENAPKGVSDQLFHRKQIDEEIARQVEQLTSVAESAATAFAARVAVIREAAQQAALDRDAILAALARS